MWAWTPPQSVSMRHGLDILCPPPFYIPGRSPWNTSPGFGFHPFSKRMAPQAFFQEAFWEHVGLSSREFTGVSQDPSIEGGETFRSFLAVRRAQLCRVEEGNFPPGNTAPPQKPLSTQNPALKALGFLVFWILQLLLVVALLAALLKHRRTKQALLKSQEMVRKAIDEWKTTFDSVPDPMVVFDDQFRIVRVNQATASLFGLSHEQIIGKPCDALISETNKVYDTGLLERCAQSKDHEEEEIHDAARDRWFLASASPITDTQGRTTGFLYLARDVTEQKQAQAEAHRRLTELAHVTRVASLGELASSLAHEINQPLTAILANAQAAQRFLAAPNPDLHEVEQILGDIVGDVKRVGEVVRRMRELLRKQTPSYESFNLNEAVLEAVTLASSAAPLNELAITLSTLTDPIIVKADRVQLQQVLFNLLMNAAAAMKEMPRPLRRIAVTTEVTSERVVRVSVTDCGPGIPERDAHRIFEPFYTTKPDGMGMGLSISRTIIKAHGGEMQGFNNPEGGATFTFTLPWAGNAATLPE